jgi:hypothetical protein
MGTTGRRSEVLRMLEDVLERVQTVNDAILKSGSEAIWYRGHRCAHWKLTSTLHRYIEDIERLTPGVVPSLDQRRRLLRDEAKSLFRRFKVEAWPLLAPSERSDWGVVFAMQHYRLPTRLLDWMER